MSIYCIDLILLDTFNRYFLAYKYTYYSHIEKTERGGRGTNNTNLEYASLLAAT